MRTPDFNALRAHFDWAIKEDIGDGDHSALSCLDPSMRGSAQLIAKENGVIAGIALAEWLFTYLDPSAKLVAHLKDGDRIQRGDLILEIEANSIKLLQAERLVLNFMQRLSGIATKTAEYQSLIAHTGCTVLDTRKTTPGLRVLEKWAVALGGGTNHRMGLYDMVMLKDNHIDFVGGIAPAVAQVKSYLAAKDKPLEIEVETRNMAEVAEALEAGVDRIMLDNFTVEDTAKAVAFIDGRCATESSGGITLDSIVPYAECGVNYISIGALTHHIKSLDLSLKAV